MSEGEVHDLLLKEGYVAPGPIGSPVDSMGRVTARAVAIGLKYGVPLDVMRHAMTPLDEGLPDVRAC